MELYLYIKVAYVVAEKDIMYVVRLIIDGKSSKMKDIV
jgi:hypothetical protein